MRSVRFFPFAIGLVGLLVLGCADRPSSSSSAPSGTSDTADASGAAMRAAPWDEARRRGAQFRAIGQEPGWLVEVTAGSLRVEWNYAQQVASGPLVASGTSATGDTVRYRAETEAAGLVVVEAVERRCVDPMNGDEFPRTVTVRLPTDTLTGCGRKLR